MKSKENNRKGEICLNVSVQVPYGYNFKRRDPSEIVSFNFTIP